jgi:hypothetical protein
MTTSLISRPGGSLILKWFFDCWRGDEMTAEPAANCGNESLREAGAVGSLLQLLRFTNFKMIAII